MEERIRHIVKSLKTGYILFWVVAILLVIGGETELLPVGILADNVRACYFLETIGILLTAVCIPLSMKLFSLVLTRKIDKLTFPIALSRYASWSFVRLGLLGLVVIYNLLCYYMTLSSTGALCALCALTASFFCLPGEKRLRNELHIDKEE
ncbi:hypothetical protein [Bacteroides sp.]